MSMSTLWPWAATIGGWVLAAAGVLVAYIALFRDRARGRKRCPKCWYDMAGAPSLMCPECGRAAKGEGKLSKTRRHKRLAVVGLVVMVVGYETTRVPLLTRVGWTAGLPTTVLVAIAPARLDRPWMYRTVGIAGSTPKATQGRAMDHWLKERGEDLTRAMWQRIDSDRPWNWQMRWYLRRALRGMEAKVNLAEDVHVPQSWPRGVAIPVFTTANGVRGGGVSLDGAAVGADGRWTSEGVFALEASEHETDAVEVRYGVMYRGGLVWSAVVSKKVRIRGEGAECLQNVDGREDSQRVRLALNPRLRVDEQGGVRVIVDHRLDTERWRVVDVGACVDIEVRADGEVVGRGRADAEWGWLSSHAEHAAEMTWVPGAHQKLSTPGTVWTITVTGNAERAWAMYRASPFDKLRAACWTGRFEVSSTVWAAEDEARDQAEEEKEGERP